MISINIFKTEFYGNQKKWVEKNTRGKNCENRGPLGSLQVDHLNGVILQYLRLCQFFGQ